MIEEENKVEIKRVENGFALKSISPMYDDDGDLTHFQEETQVFQTKEEHGDEDKEMAEALAETFWSAMEELWVVNSKHNDWVLDIELKERKEEKEELDKKVDEKIDAFISSIAYLWKEEPLDGDATEQISKRVLEKLDKLNGNEE